MKFIKKTPFSTLDLLRQGRQEVPEELLPVPDDDLQQQDRQVEPEEIAVAPENDELYNGIF
jgi:hypothetical protein